MQPSLYLSTYFSISRYLRFDIHGIFRLFKILTFMDLEIPGRFLSHEIYSRRRYKSRKGRLTKACLVDLQRIFKDPLELKCCPEEYDQSNRVRSRESRARSHASSRMPVWNAHQSAPLNRGKRVDLRKKVGGPLDVRQENEGADSQVYRRPNS